MKNFLLGLLIGGVSTYMVVCALIAEFPTRFKEFAKSIEKEC